MVNLSKTSNASYSVLQVQYLFIIVKLTVYFTFFIVVAFFREDFTERRQHHSSNEYTVKLMIAGSINILFCPRTFGVCLKLAYITFWSLHKIFSVLERIYFQRLVSCDVC